jgi:hypothetical protein
VKVWSERARIWRFPGYNEHESMGFISDILLYIFPFDAKLTVISEYKIKGRDFGGALDVAVCAKTYSENPVVYIIEAKKGDLQQGRAQLYLQLNLCHEISKKEQNWDYPIYGVISTGHLWIFVVHDGRTYIEAEPIFIANTHDHANIEKVVEFFYKIIHIQNHMVAPLIDENNS